MKRLKRLAGWFVVILCFTAFSAPLAHLAFRPNPRLADAEQYVVYSSYIQLGLTGESHALGNKRGPVVIHGTTIVSDRLANKSKPNQFRFVLGTAGHTNAVMSQLKPSVLLEFFVANLDDEKLERQFGLSATYELATEQEMDLYPSEQFSKRFPNSYGYLTFSRIGFNHDLTEALFYTEHICGLCGEGKYVFMRKINGRWDVDGTASTWIS